MNFSQILQQEKVFSLKIDLTNFEDIIKSNQQRMQELGITKKVQEPQIVYENKPSIELLNLHIDEHLKELDQIAIERKNKLDGLIVYVRSLIKQLLNYESEVFGSYATGLNLPDSDIDIVIIGQTTQFIIDQMRKLDHELKKQPYIEESKSIFKAAIPVLKLKCTPEYYNQKLDISFSEPKHNGLQCVSLMIQYGQIYTYLKPLSLILRQFLIYMNLLDPYQGGLSSYGLNLMIICYLQTCLIQKSIGEHLIEFLYLFGCEMDYVAKTIYVFAPYQQITHYPIFFNPQLAVNSEALLLIADPMNEKHNVGRSTYNIAGIKFVFAVAFAKLLYYDFDSLDEFMKCSERLIIKSNLKDIYKQ
ncbi:hypothetical protein pb186bvf_001612 [Paramecium bursaria]